MEAKKETFKIFKNIKMYKKNDKISDNYTIIDINETFFRFKRDFNLISKIIQILQKKNKIIDNALKSLNEIDKNEINEIDKNEIDKNEININEIDKNEININEIYPFGNRQKKPNILSVFFEEIQKKINKHFEDLYNAIKEIIEKMTKIEYELNAYSESKDQLVKKKSNLENDLNEFVQIETNFFNERDNLFKNLLNHKGDINKNKVYQEKDFTDIKKSYMNYLKQHENYSKKVINYCEYQNVFLKAGNGWLDIIKKLNSINLISAEEKNNYIKRFFREEEKLDHFYIIRQKRNKLPLITMDEYIETEILREAVDPDRKNLKELFVGFIPFFVGWNSSEKDLNQDVELYDGLHQIFCHKKPKLKFKDWWDKWKEDNRKTKIVDFLNKFTTKELNSDLCKQLAECFIELQKKFLEDKDYKHSKMLYNIVGTFFYQKNQKNVYISEFVNKDPSFINKQFIFDLLSYYFTEEKLKTGSDDEKIEYSQMINSLYLLLGMKWDRIFVEEIFYGFLQKKNIQNNEGRNELYNAIISQHYYEENLI